MEQEWLRQEASLPLTLAFVDGLLAPHGLRPASLYPLAEGKANTNTRVDLVGGRTLVLRVYQREQATLLLEMALLRQFRGELPVAEVVLADPSVGWTLLEYLPGRSLQAAAAEGAVGEILAAAPEIGRALARIATVKFERAGFLDASLKVRDSWNSVIEGLEGYLDMCLARPVLAARVGDDLVRRVRKARYAARPTLEALTFQANLVHGDFKPSNLLVHEGRLSGVLDWEFAHSGTWLLDAGLILRHRAVLPPGFAGALEAGLGDGGVDVPADWQRLAGVVDLMSLVDFLGRDACSEATVAHIVGLIAASLGSG